MSERINERKEGKEVGERVCVGQVSKLKVRVGSGQNGVCRRNGLVLLWKGSNREKRLKGSSA